MWRHLLTLLILPSAAHVHAQSAISGRYVLEPIIGYHVIAESNVGFGAWSDGLTVVGGRILFRRSFSTSAFVELFSGARSNTDVYTYEGGRTEQTIDSRRTIGTVGVGSTLVDRDATGTYGIHVLLGIGFVKEDAEFWTREQSSSNNQVVHRGRDSSSDPLISMAAQVEFELFSPRVLLRSASSLLIGMRLTKDKYEGFLWLPGITLTTGIAVAL